MTTGTITRVPHAGPPDIAVCLIDLDAYAARTRLCGLSAEEHARASRMRARQDALRYLATRHALRALLAKALGAQPDALEITADTAGKPRLAGASAPRFNVSHSGGLALIGIARAHEIGVDIEHVRGIDDAGALAAAHFTRAEQAEWRAAGASEQLFLSCWTRKEACLKAAGVGLSADPAGIAVGCAPRTTRVPVTLPALGEVALYGLDVPCEALAALAAL